YGEDLTEEIAEKIGKAFGTFIGYKGRVVIGRDVRLSGDSLQKALIEGVLSTGCNVLDVGVLPTPIFYFSIVHYGADGGIVVTASHNPAEWNGFKFCREMGSMLAEGLGLENIKRIILKEDFRVCSTGKIEKHNEIIDVYSNFILKMINMGDKTLKVAVDTGNGTCSLLVPKLLRKIGVDVVAINNVPDGRFPAHKPEPTAETLKELMNLVLEEEADFGVGYDGDGDRAIFIDNKGRIIPGDVALIIMAQYYLAQKKGTVVYDISCSMAVEDAIKRLGGRPVMSRVGRAYLTEAMRRENAILGGELSGHLYFSEIFGFDDAIYGSLKMAEHLSRRRENLSEIVDAIPKYPAIPIKEYECPDELKFKVVAELAEDFRKMGFEIVTIDGVKVVDREGWFLIRASNTLPQIKMRAEAKSISKLNELIDLAERKILEKIK
ncbi:TPA: phosphomannomutase/phosphoglucomutase, partial [Candidatus Bathyarchaeota archaeon]|nr:phosphomannomutase/phosphoglucomutase [Candidatus Bathyarchaeota archaeon]